MSIKVQCPNPACGRVFNVKEELAGRKAKCPGCSSPLIIPTPDQGVFDFGSLAGEAANPFTEPAAAPSPVKPTKKPTPDSGARKPPAVPEALSKVAAPPMPVAEVIAEPAAESVPAVGATPTPSVAEPQRPAPFPNGEPWFYRFLESYAKVLMILGLLAAVVSLLFSIWFVISMYSIGAGIVMTTLYAIGALCGAALFVLAVMLSVAFVLLSVDVGRNLREIRRLLTKDKSPD